MSSQINLVFQPIPFAHVLCLSLTRNLLLFPTTCSFCSSVSSLFILVYFLVVTHPWSQRSRLLAARSAYRTNPFLSSPAHALVEYNFESSPGSFIVRSQFFTISVHFDSLALIQLYLNISVPQASSLVSSISHQFLALEQTIPATK